MGVVDSTVRGIGVLPDALVLEGLVACIDCWIEENFGSVPRISFEAMVHGLFEDTRFSSGRGVWFSRLTGSSFCAMGVASGVFD